MSIFVYDCSNSDYRPSHRKGGGPLTNDVIRQLKEHAALLDLEFVENPACAHVLLTNDVFPETVAHYDLPRFKRMDGIFHRDGLLSRNERLNKAAQEADHVVFISDFAKRSYLALYGEPLKSSSVVLNTANPQDYPFYPKRYKPTGPWNFVVVATDWNREEKRWADTLAFAARHKKEVFLSVVGTPPQQAPMQDNVSYLGYSTSYAKILQSSHAMLSLSYKDAAPKTVCQGLASGLPILSVSSGGTPELVRTCGYGMPDCEILQKEASVPLLDSALVDDSFEEFKAHYADYAQALKERDFKKEFWQMLESYSNRIHEVAKE